MYTSFEQKNEADRLRREREFREKAQPVVITGVQIPFWRVVWWLAGITAGVTLVHTAFDWLIRFLVALFAGEPQS
jgi:hypothetical protein